MYQLVFTQKVDGSFINHQSIEIPVSNFKIKHEFKCDKNYQEYLKISKECEDRVIKFKKEQAVDLRNDPFDAKDSAFLEENKVALGEHRDLLSGSK